MCTYHVFFVYPLDFANVHVIGDDWCVLRDEVALEVLTGSQGNTQSIEIGAGSWINALAFTTNGEYLLSGGSEGVRV